MRRSCTTLYLVCIVIAFTDIVRGRIYWERLDLDPAFCVYMSMAREAEEFQGRKAYLLTPIETESRWLI